MCAAYAYLLAGCAIPVFCMAMVTNAATYIIERLLIGCSLAAFVVCQFWSSIMFAPTVVGMANAIAGGWGNAGARIAPPGLLAYCPWQSAMRHACLLHACAWAAELPPD
jgi:NNP family nitrate/nitrite transporter-like MFS transporter